MKKTNNSSKWANVCKTIFSGMGKILTATALLVGLTFLCPALLIVGGTIIQIGGWVVLFGIVIILPIWGVGKLFGAKNKTIAEEETIDLTDKDKEKINELRKNAAKLRSSSKPKEGKEEVDYKAYYEEKLKAETDEIKRVYKEKTAALKRDKRKELNKKVVNVKIAVKDLFK